MPTAKVFHSGHSTLWCIYTSSGELMLGRPFQCIVNETVYWGRSRGAAIAPGPARRDAAGRVRFEQCWAWKKLRNFKPFSKATNQPTNSPGSLWKRGVSSSQQLSLYVLRPKDGEVMLYNPSWFENHNVG